MPTIDITIGRRSFQLVCGDGQEEHLKKLASEVSNRVDGLAESVGSNNDTLLLVMSALMMQDELNNVAGGEVSLSSLSGGISQEEQEKNINNAVADAVDAIAQYVENVADRIDAS